MCVVRNITIVNFYLGEKENVRREKFSEHTASDWKRGGILEGTVFNPKQWPEKCCKLWSYKWPSGLFFGYISDS